MKDELEEVELILYDVFCFVYQIDNKKVIIYIYDLMVNLVFIWGQFENVE